jgi:hypothetical protein
MEETIFNEILKALGHLFIAGIALFAYKTAVDNAKGGKVKIVLWKGFLWCAGIALFTSLIMGAPTCEQGSDPVYGGCDYYADDGYEPSTEKRTGRFAYFMALLYLPVVIGAFSGNKEKITQ